MRLFEILNERWSDSNVLSSEEWTKRTGASGTRKFLVRIIGQNQYVVYDRLAIRDDVVAGPFEHDDQAWAVADEHEEKYNQGYADWLARGNKGMEPGAVKLAGYKDED